MAIASRSIAALTSALAFLAAGAMAEDRVSLADPASVANTLRLEGYRAKIHAQETGAPAILSGSGGSAFDIQFVGCEGYNACRGLLFTARFDLDGGIDLERINSWNSERYVGRAFVTRDCDPVIDHYVAITPEISSSEFVTLVETWSLTLKDFRAFVGFDDNGPHFVAKCQMTDTI
ncbi:MAG: YbjN domain-containing protein [Pseudomonadota bacterium]